MNCIEAVRELESYRPPAKPGVAHASSGESAPNSNIAKREALDLRRAVQDLERD